MFIYWIMKRDMNGLIHMHTFDLILINFSWF